MSFPWPCAGFGGKGAAGSSYCEEETCAWRVEPWNLPLPISSIHHVHQCITLPIGFNQSCRTEAGTGNAPITTAGLLNLGLECWKSWGQTFLLGILCWLICDWGRERNFVKRPICFKCGTPRPIEHEYARVNFLHMLQVPKVCMTVQLSPRSNCFKATPLAPDS